MPATDPYKEVLIVTVLGIVIVLVIASLVVFLFLYYRKKRLRHRDELEQLQKQFSEAMFRSQLEIQEQTFTYISREIHDNVGQLLSFARIQIGIMTESGRIELSMLEDVKDNVGKALADLRNIAKSLNSDRIRKLPIHDSVSSEVERINRTAKLFMVEVMGKPCDLDEGKKLIIFRIIQEGIQNCLKHSGASHADISFFYGKELEVNISDNGVGFDLSTVNEPNQLGLDNMRARAILAGGTCKIESEVQKGTLIKITMPYE